MSGPGLDFDFSYFGKRTLFDMRCSSLHCVLKGGRTRLVTSFWGVSNIFRNSSIMSE